MSTRELDFTFLYIGPFIYTNKLIKRQSLKTMINMNKEVLLNI